MKKLFLLFRLALAFTLFTTPAVAQESLKPKTQAEIIAALCHSWRLTAMEALGTRLPPPIKVDFTYLVLKDDGTCVKTSGGEEITGEWLYKPKVMTLLIKDKNGSTLYMLMKITEKEFTYKVKISGYYSNMVMTRVEE